MMQATFDDVNLILRLYEMRRDDRMREARNWFTGNFKVRTLEEWTALCAPGTDANASYRMVTSYWEMVASFITSGVLNPELFYQSGGEMLFAAPPIQTDTRSDASCGCKALCGFQGRVH